MLGIKAPAEKKPQRKIAFYSKRREIDQKEYRKIVKELLQISDLCEIKAKGCTLVATGLQHKAKRSPGNFLDRKNLLRSCDSCNLWIELHPLEAIEKGFSISKFSKVG